MSNLRPARIAVTLAALLAFSVLIYGLYDVNAKQNRLAQTICHGSNASRVQINREISRPLRKLLKIASKRRAELAVIETTNAKEHLRIAEIYGKMARDLDPLRLVDCNS